MDVHALRSNFTVVTGRTGTRLGLELHVKDETRGYISLLQGGESYHRKVAQLRSSKNIERLGPYLEALHLPLVPGVSPDLQWPWVLLSETLGMFHHDGRPPEILDIQNFDFGLDPFQAKFFLNRFKSISEEWGMRVVLTTRSPWILDQVWIGSILIGFTHQDEYPGFRWMDEQPEVKPLLSKFTPGAIFAHEFLRLTDPTSRPGDYL